MELLTSGSQKRIEDEEGKNKILSEELIQTKNEHTKLVETLKKQVSLPFYMSKF